MTLLDEPLTAEGPDDESASPTRLDRLRAVIDRHPWIFVFAVAWVLRFVLAVYVWRVHDGRLFGDETMYTSMATAKAAGHAGGWDAYTNQLYAETATLTYPLTFVYWVLWPMIFVAQLMVVFCGALAAALTARMAAHVVPRRLAIVAGLIVAVYPSQILWSSISLKDGIVWAVTAGIALAVARLNRAEDRRELIRSGLLVLVTLVLVGRLRNSTFVVACYATFVAAWFGTRVMRRERVLVTAAFVVLVPFVVGMGLAGQDFIVHQGNSVEGKRVSGGEGAATAILGDQTTTTTTTTATTVPTTSTLPVDVVEVRAAQVRAEIARLEAQRAELERQYREAASSTTSAPETTTSAPPTTSPGSTGSPTTASTAAPTTTIPPEELDEAIEAVSIELEEQKAALQALEVISDPSPADASTTTVAPTATTTTVAPSAADVGTEFGASLGIDGNLKYLPTGVEIMLLEPKPWQSSGNRNVDLVRAEMIPWYALLALAAVGIASSWRRRGALAFVIVFLGTQTVVFALSEGNFGTAYRHRGELLWPTVVLAAFGLSVLLRRFRPAPAAPVETT